MDLKNSPTIKPLKIIYQIVQECGSRSEHLKINHALFYSYIKRRMLKIEKNEDMLQNSQWHAVPATLMTSEPIENAKISNYFRPTIVKDNGLSAFMQGHLLKGTTHDLDHLYRAVTYKPDDSKEDVEIVLTERVREIVDWRKDISWDPYEGHIGSLLKYNAIQAALHSQ